MPWYSYCPCSLSAKAIPIILRPYVLFGTSNVVIINGKYNGDNMTSSAGEQCDELVAHAANLLRDNHLLVATAESCTGGMLAMRMTQLAGSSAWFDRGWVTYTNAAKMAQLEVLPTLLEQQGAVSEACVLAMAAGALRHSQADISISVSGIAGPTGAVDGKPVGTVWLAWAHKNGKSRAQLCQFSGDRQTVREQATAQALIGLIERLEK